LQESTLSTRAANTAAWRAVLLEEPFRIFFPLGALGGLLGVFLWLAPHVGLGPPFVGFYHGLLQIQGFVMPFAVGFLMTVLPRFLEAQQARGWEIALSAVLLVGGGLSLYLGAWQIAELGFMVLLLHLSVFALRRFAARGDNPPPAFILVGFALLCGLGGGLLLLFPPSGFVRLGQNLQQQGIVLALVMAVGSYLGPRLLYGVKGFPETEGPAFRKKCWMYGAAGVLLLGSFAVEAGWAPVWGRLLRALLVTVQLLAAVGIHRRPQTGRWHLYLLWLAFWSVPTGLWLAGSFPAYEIAMLHLTFAGGFALLTLMVASRVVTGHCDLQDLWMRNAWSLLLPGLLLILAAAARLAADLYPAAYLELLSGSSALWLLGILLWVVVFVPKTAPWRVAPDE